MYCLLVVDMVGRSDFPTVTQYTKEQIRLIRALTPTGIAFVSEKAVKCPFCVPPREGHIPDLIVDERLAVFVDGSIHNKRRIQKKDQEADRHLLKMDYLVYRITNEEVRRFTDIIVKEIVRKLNR